MSRIVVPETSPDSDYLGIPSILEYTNADGIHTRFNCGQAAACTFLTQLGKLEPSATAMRDIEAQHAPDNFGGYLGTSRRCVERICRMHGVRPELIAGESPLRQWLSERKPVMVMLGMDGPTWLGYPLPVGHWMVAYGMDRAYVYLTNFGRMPWDAFRAGWNRLVPRLIGIHNRGIVANP